MDEKNESRSSLGARKKNSLAHNSLFLPFLLLLSLVHFPRERTQNAFWSGERFSFSVTFEIATQEVHNLTVLGNKFQFNYRRKNDGRSGYLLYFGSPGGVHFSHHFCGRIDDQSPEPNGRGFLRGPPNR